MPVYPFLKDGEEIVAVARKHWIVYVKQALLHLYGCAVCIALAVFLISRKGSTVTPVEGITPVALILIAFVILFWSSFFYFWTKNYFDVWYITTSHIVAVNQKNIFEREESFMELTKIQDVSFEKEGIIATYFGYGKLQVQTAGSIQEFAIDYISNVETVAHRIMDLRDNAQGKNNISL